jgi:hypothetical protein
VLSVLDLFRSNDLNLDGCREALDRNAAERFHVVALGMKRKTLGRLPLFDEH